MEAAITSRIRPEPRLTFVCAGEGAGEAAPAAPAVHLWRKAQGLCGRSPAQGRSSSEKGNLAALKECLEDGGDVTQTASNGNTALHWAAFHSFTDMIEVLLQTGAVLDAPGNHE